MKKIFYLLSLLIFTPVVSYANCTPPPPPPNCSMDGPVSVSVDGRTINGTISGDSISIRDPYLGTLNGTVNKSMGTFSVSVSGGPILHGTIENSSACSSYDPIKYKADTLSYEVCQQTENPSYDSSGKKVYCYAPITEDCNENMLGAIAVEQNMNGMGNSSIGQGAIQACKDKHIQYQTELNKYNTCLNTKFQSPSLTPSVSNNSITPTLPTQCNGSNKEIPICQTQNDYCTSHYGKNSVLQLPAPTA